jgi:hypothetical protein
MAREVKTVRVMVSLYCQHHHRTNKLCAECLELTDYALERLQKCPFQEGKTTCNKCPVHCYQPLMREKIRSIMRYAGPRMTLRHPILALFHFMDRLRKKPIGLIDETQG